MKSLLRYLLLTLRNVVIFFFVSTLIMVVAFKYVPVYFTPLMFLRSVSQIKEGEWPQMAHHWVPLENISHDLPQAVMASEDNLFLQHKGFDFVQIHQARIDALRGKRERGASTITQQTAKNVFLWPGHSWLRKGLEAYFTVLIEHIWGKRRIMEVYLNSIEMGRGIYGAEAVAHLHFDTDAKHLNRRQCALIADSLPNPLERDSGHPTAYMNKRQRQIVSLMNKIDKFPTE